MTDSHLKILCLAIEMIGIGFIVGVLVGFYIGKKMKK